MVREESVEKWVGEREEDEGDGESHAISNRDTAASSSSWLSKEVQVNAPVERPMERGRETVVEKVVVVDRPVPIP